MLGYSPGLFDKLMNVNAVQNNSISRLSLEEIKDLIAKDLEYLLNTREVRSEAGFGAFSEINNSIVTYGLHDFAGLSLSSANDRQFICRAIQQAIVRHEPRLQNVQVSIGLSDCSTNRLNFAISALLVLKPEQEPVNFDAILQPSSLQYSISKTRRVIKK